MGGFIKYDALFQKVTYPNMAQESNPEIIKVEGNLIETFPAHFERPRGHKNRAITETIATANGKITVRHNSRLFSAFDKDVLLAAFALAQRTGQRRFRAVLSDFARVMRINPFGKNLVRIRESLNELAMTPAEFTESWRDAQNRRYTSEAVTSFIAYRLVDRREIMETKLSPKEIRDGSWIAIPDLFYDSIENGYFRYIDAEVYFSLPSGITRAAYLYLEKRLGIKNHYEEKIDSAIANIIKRPPTPKDIKNFKYRTIPKLSGAFRFDKKKLKKGMLAVSRRVLFNGAMPETADATAKAAAEEKADAAAGAVGAAAGMAAEAGGEADPETAAIADAAEAGGAIAPADDNFVPRAAIRGTTNSSVSPPASVCVEPHPLLRSRASFPTFPAEPRPRKKLTSRGEYVLERACIFCNRDDDYFKNVIRKYIFLRGADLVGGAIGDTRDANAESKDRYFIHLLKNL